MWNRRQAILLTFAEHWTILCTSSTLERLEQFAKEYGKGTENYVGASARNMGVGWDRGGDGVVCENWCGARMEERESSELPYYYSENS